MSVLINGMEMPDSCYHCKISDSCRHYKRNYTNSRHKYCPLKEVPSAQPDIIWCKDCKHWKDSDGVYRRGIGAESKCPVNIRAVYEGNFYCADAERKEGGADEAD